MIHSKKVELYQNKLCTMSEGVAIGRGGGGGGGVEHPKHFYVLIILLCGVSF